MPRSTPWPSAVAVLLLVAACLVAPALGAVEPDSEIAAGNQSTRADADGVFTLRNLPIGFGNQFPSEGRYRYQVQVRTDAAGLASDTFTLENGERRLVSGFSLADLQDRPRALSLAIDYLTGTDVLKVGDRFEVIVRDQLGRDRSGSDLLSWTVSNNAGLERDSSAAQEERLVYTVTDMPRGRSALLIIHLAGVTTTKRLSFDEDSDGDGIPDVVERRFGLDPDDPNDGGLDSDGDGLANGEEILDVGSDPFNPDTDRDGLDDGVDPEPLTPERESPVVLIQAPIDGADLVAGASVTVSGTANDNATVRLVRVLVDGALAGSVEAAGPFVFAVSLPLREGTVPITVEARDAVGNRGSASIGVDLSLPDDNLAPEVDAGSDLLIALGVDPGELLRGRIVDDGKPDPPGALLASWTQIDGPQAATIDPDGQAIGKVTIPAPGTYTFQLQADDGGQVASDQMAVTAIAGGGDTVLVSHALGSSAPADDDSELGRVSADGRYVVFRSRAGDLVADAFTGRQIFCWDRLTGDVILVSRNQEGQPGDGFSDSPGISGDGEWIVFDSTATNLVPGDSGNRRDVFVVHRASGAIERISETPLGAGGDGNSEAPSISADGGRIAFQTTATNLDTDPAGFRHVLVWDRAGDTFEEVTAERFNNPDWPPTPDGERPVISPDGSRVVFASTLPAYGPPGYVDDQRLQLYAAAVDQAVLEPVSIADGSMLPGDSDLPSVDWDAGRVAFQTIETEGGGGAYGPPPDVTVTTHLKALGATGIGVIDASVFSSSTTAGFAGPSLDYAGRLLSYVPLASPSDGELRVRELPSGNEAVVVDGLDPRRSGFHLGGFGQAGALDTKDRIVPADSGSDNDIHLVPIEFGPAPVEDGDALPGGNS